MGAHSVGVEDGGPGLPVTGWSTEGGDLRVAHFVGLHGSQVVPLLGLAAARLGRGRLGAGHRVALVWVGGLAYLAVVVLTTWQALRGQPLLDPDGLTLAVLATVVLVTVGAAVAVAAHGWRRAPTRRRPQRHRPQRS